MKFHYIFALILANFLYHATCFHNVIDDHQIVGNSREALEIIIGGGGGGGGCGCDSPPPPTPPRPPPPCPPPPSPPTLLFESKRIELVYPVIQNFKKKIKQDPFGITDTWVGPDICNKYRGFICDVLLDYNEKALAGVTFNGFNFDGPLLTLDGFIDQLPDIIVFHANSNNFKGTIPSKISKLKYLYELDLSNNKFTCEFPYQVLGATKLTFLDLRFNTFSGLVPAQLFMLDVDVLFINNNYFNQQLPDNLGSTPAQYITLANNNFSGPIPRSIGQAAKTLIEILLLNNQLSGCLPREIGLLEKMTLLDASQNCLTGPIPQSFACLAQIQILNLAQNQLYGPVPDVVCKLPNLGNLSLSYNYFTEVGPECMKLIKANVLDVRMNCISGLPGQRSQSVCHDFLSKAKACGDESHFNWVPDTGSFHQNFFKSSRYAPAGRVESKRSYNVLNPHRL
ncbi:hypothetical protein F511_18819 [Dorcoceras hygrometricum]|uniref:Uncharacterized protein n=1 Tax=Dorcoceras hygrometricum TaxID=472368 RepID=A0A2Z7CUF9_9LAMI|nr:hypothetical protein F511_18819 [Dorcoceras hygrometricum]